MVINTIIAFIVMRKAYVIIFLSLIGELVLYRPVFILSMLIKSTTIKLVIPLHDIHYMQYFLSLSVLKI